MCFGEEERGKRLGGYRECCDKKKACYISDSDTYKARFEKCVYITLN
jgi:hypothetical protein